MDASINIHGTYDATFTNATASAVREILATVNVQPRWAASFPPSLEVWLQPATEEVLNRAEALAAALREVPTTRSVTVTIAATPGPIVRKRPVRQRNPRAPRTPF